MAETYWERKFWDPDIETMPRKAVRELQKRKLFLQLIYAYENAPFYHELYDKEKVDVYKIRTIEDFQKYVPVVDKEMVRKHREKTGDPLGGVCCLPLTAKSFHTDMGEATSGRFYRSTGTTGLPTIVIYSKHDTDIVADLFCRVMWAAGVRPGDRFLDFLSPRWHPGAGFQFTGMRRMGAIIYLEDYAFWELGMELGRLLDINFVGATPIPLRNMAAKAAREGKAIKDYFPHLKGGIRTGELAQSIGKYYHDAYQVPINDCYPITETMFVTWSCKEEGNWPIHCHIPEDSVFCEVTDPKTHQAAEVDFGEIVYTILFSESMVYIRWRSEDWHQVNYDPCPYCGYTHMQCRPMGRTSESVEIKGKLITMAEIEDVIYERPESVFLPIQLVREEPQPQDKLRVRICYHADRVKEPERYRVEVEEALKKALGVDSLVDLITPEEVASVLTKFVRVVKVKRGE